MAYTFLSGKMIPFSASSLIGVTEYGYKELVLIEDGYQESEAN
ncbi:MAG: hypothetical protein ACTS73_06960 [Arsenophonus sp. NEOnobi-MAG3]